MVVVTTPIDVSSTGGDVYRYTFDHIIILHQ